VKTRDEFGFIAQSLAPLSRGYAGAFGLTDDAALLASKSGLVVTSDTLVEGVHFRSTDPAALVARKAIRVNVSDLVAMAATPHAIMLSIVWPSDLDAAYQDEFVKGLKTDLDHFGLPLIGGDTTRGGDRMVITVAAFGETSQPLRRNAARPGDGLFVTGTIGDAVLGLRATSLGLSADHEKFLSDRYLLPEPRVEIIDGLKEFASAGLDISDGLVADAGHLSTASSVRFDIQLDAIPVSVSAAVWLATLPDRNAGFVDLVTGGDDYEILFTASGDQEAGILAAAANAGVRVTKIGRADQGGGVDIRASNGEIVQILQTGFTHF
jgi:thiamine-monophosphate kinase